VFPGFSISSPNRNRGVLSGFYRPTSLGGARIGLGEWQDHLSQILTIRAEPLRRSGSMPCQTPVSENARHSSSENARYGAAAITSHPQKLQFRPLAPPRGRPISCLDFRKCAFRRGRPTPICQEPHRPGRRKVKQRTFSETVSSLAIRGRNRYPPLGAPMQVSNAQFRQKGTITPPPTSRTRISGRVNCSGYAHFRKI
jgi:hypothetical protein